MLRTLHPDGDGLRNNNANRADGIRYCSIACEPFQGQALRVAGFPLWLCRLETTLPAGVQLALEIYGCEAGLKMVVFYAGQGFHGCSPFGMPRHLLCDGVLLQMDVG